MAGSGTSEEGAAGPLAVPKYVLKGAFWETSCEECVEADHEHCPDQAGDPEDDDAALCCCFVVEVVQ